MAKQAGDEVFAGTVNGTGALRVRVERDPSDSVIARIVKMVEEASETKAPTQLFIEKIEQRYSIGMVIATLAVFGTPLAFGDTLQSALLRAMTFMIVASPCAVVLSTMPPLLSAIANAGRRGVLAKSAVVMERLGQVDLVALDKTGTLTEGTPRVTRVHPLPGSGLDEDGLLALAAAAEHPSEHPLARAVVEAARERGLHLPAVTGFSSVPGEGVTATVDGHTVQVGSPSRLLTDSATAPHETIVAELEDSGRTAVAVLRHGTVMGVLGIADRLRPDAAATVAALTKLTGRTPVLLTGDNESAARHLAAEVGITDVRAGLLPQDKVAAVKAWEAEGRRVLVVGDGVNDAPALAAAHSGIAMGKAGSDLALETADAIVVRDELATIPSIVQLSRTARRLVIQNLAIAESFTSTVAKAAPGQKPPGPGDQTAPAKQPGHLSAGSPRLRPSSSRAVERPARCEREAALVLPRIHRRTPRECRTARPAACRVPCGRRPRRQTHGRDPSAGGCCCCSSPPSDSAKVNGDRSDVRHRMSRTSARSS
ncbi:Potassium-transporting ATPase ATP-binding subunit [Streptomyces cyaneofuscatus]